MGSDLLLSSFSTISADVGQPANQLPSLLSRFTSQTASQQHHVPVVLTEISNGDLIDFFFGLSNELDNGFVCSVCMARSVR